jgi:hypothetical protein
MKISHVLHCSCSGVRSALLAACCLATLVQARAQTNLIVNGGFETGVASPWVVTGGANAYSDLDGAVPRTGTYCLWLGGNPSEVDQAYQTVTIPVNATSATLAFYYTIYSEETGSVVHDTFTASIRNNSGGLLASVTNLSNVNQDASPNYHLQNFNLLPYAGQSIRIQFDSSNNSTLITSFFIDDVSVSVTTPAAPPTNDVCSAAIPLAAGVTYTINTASATSTGDPSPSCQASFGKGVWYTYIPATNGNVTISTCGSDFNTVLAVYSGSCGSLNPVACADDNGPACSGTQASATYAATGGTTYFILAGGYNGAAGNLSIVATGPGGMKIIPSFDSTITSDPQAAAIEATINSAIAIYQSTFSDPITVYITFQEVTTGLGSSSSFYNNYNYSDYRAALISHATTTDDATAIAHLPNTVNNPVNTNAIMKLHLPLARALGFTGADSSPAAPDGTISLNISSMNISPLVTDTNKYSLLATVCHEINEVIGMASALNNLNNGDAAPTGAISPEDLFRYTSAGARSFDTGVNTACYFSLDGATDLVRFNQHQNGDFQDFYSYYGGQTPEVQDAYGTPGANPVLGTELRILDAIGFTRIVSTARPTLSLAHVGNNAVITWPSSFIGFSLQSATNLTASVVRWITNTPAPVLSNGQYAVTNTATGVKFYRLIK